MSLFYFVLFVVFIRFCILINFNVLILFFLLVKVLVIGKRFICLIFFWDFVDKIYWVVWCIN